MRFSALLNSCGKSLLALAMACTGFAVTLTRGEITTIALTGDPAPDGDGTLATLHLPVLNDRGWVAFLADQTGDDSGDGANEGVFLANRTSIEVLAHHGDPAPGGDVELRQTSPGLFTSQFYRVEVR